ncbi:MAG TPA: hypothetical protein PK405_03185 [Hyphomicrobiales bacterium]|nr:sel1 repeat family protein [Rhodobiaceae bacterium]HXK53666.1 hypothetical protein [Hyphomicrobiales bacterium]
MLGLKARFLLAGAAAMVMLLAGGQQMRAGEAETTCTGIGEIAACRALAERGDADAQFYLGVLYATAEGTAPDLVEAYKWLWLAARGGDQYALAGRDTVAQKLTEEQRAEALRLARDWKPRP